MENIVPGALQRLRAADIIRMAGLASASLGQEYCRTGSIHGTQRQGARISGIVTVLHMPGTMYQADEAIDETPCCHTDGDETASLCSRS